MIIYKDEFLKIIDRLERYNECQDKIQDLFNDLIDNIENDFCNAGSICIGHESVVVKLLEAMFETDLISWWLYEMEYGRKIDSESLIDENNVAVDVTTPEKLYDYLIKELERKKCDGKRV